MDNMSSFQRLLELTDRPAFYVRGGCILCVNQAAAARMITPDSPVAPMLGACRCDYEQFHGGELTLELTVGSVRFCADVERLGEGDLFLLSCENEDAELRSLALAAQQLRLPLNQILNTADFLFPRLSAEAPESDRQQLAAMNRSLCQMMRIVLNMSDAHRSLLPRMELQDITAVLQEVFDRSTLLLQEAGITLQFENLPQRLLCCIDSSRMERAVYNLISNALKHSGPGSTITASLTRRNARLYLTVANSGTAGLPAAASGAFSRFLREPGIEDSRNGLGLGLRLVQSAALAHGGTVLMEPMPDGGMRVTMSIAILQNTDELHASPLRIDYAGERNHALIELSDSLPGSLYGWG